MAADVEGKALGDCTGIKLACALGDLRGDTTAGALARPVFFTLESTALGDCFLEAAGDARLADAGALDTPPLTADFGVLGLLAGDTFAATGDFAALVTGDLVTTLLDFRDVGAFGDFAGAFPLRGAMLSKTKRYNTLTSSYRTSEAYPEIMVPSANLATVHSGICHNAAARCPCKSRSLRRTCIRRRLAGAASRSMASFKAKNLNSPSRPPTGEMGQSD